MKKASSLLLCAALTVSCMAGCGNKDSKKENTKTNADQATEEAQASQDAQETEDTQTASLEKTTIKVWHDGDEAILNKIAESANSQLESQNIEVVFEKKTGLTDQLKLYGSDAANGPDMYFYAHDSLGMYAEMGILAPITDVISMDDMADMVPMTVEAGNYKDTQYLMPVYYETLLFMYNKGLWEGEVPSTTEELYDYMAAHTDVDAGTYAVVNQHSTAYNVAPFINGFGGYIIEKDAIPGLNDQATKDAITYNKKFAKLQADGDYNTITTLFNEGKAAAIIGGPWLMSGIKEAGIDLGIKSLADFALPDGNKLAPYSGVQSMGVLKYAVAEKKDAMAAVLKAIASVDTGITIAKDCNCAPANSKAYDDADVASNEMIMAMKTTAETAQPMPNIPQMSVMWGPTEAFLAAVNKSGVDVDEAAKQYQAEAVQAVADMQ